MATWEELVRMTQTQNPGMTRTPIPRGATMGGVTRGAELDNRVTSGASSRVRQPGQTEGVSSVPTTNPASRLASGLTTLTSPTQASRGTTETAANPIIGQQLRRQTAERDRIQRRLQEPGSINPVQFRALMAQQGAAQAGVDSSIAGLNAMREASVVDRGQSLGAIASLEDRQMQEAGAFDRALLGIDEAMLQGEYGLAGIEAEGRARDPYAAFTLDQLNLLTGEDASMQDRWEAANLARGLAARTAAGPAATYEGPSGVTMPLTIEQALAIEYARDPEGMTPLLEASGYGVGEDGNILPLAQLQAQQQREQAASSERRQTQRANAEEESQRNEAELQALLRRRQMNLAQREAFEQERQRMLQDRFGMNN